VPGREREHPAGGVTRGTDSPGRVTSLASVVTAIVLVSTAVDRVPEVAQAIAGLDGVSEVYSVAGEVDLVAMVRVRQHEQLAELIRELASSLGPVVDDDGQLDGEGAVPDNLLPTEWCLVVNWTDLDSGESWVSSLGPANQLKSHEIGLLLMALDRARSLG